MQWRRIVGWVRVAGLSCLLAALPTWGTVSSRESEPIRATTSTPTASRVPVDVPLSVFGVFEDFPLNVAVFRLVNTHRHPVLDTVFLAVSYLGSGWMLIPVLLVTYLRRRAYSMPLLIAVTVETLVVHALKFWCMQPRPATLLGEVTMLRPLHWGSFPSGDTAMAFAIAVTLSCGVRRPLWSFLLYAYAFLIAYERIYLGVHFPLDVVAGALLGTISALGAHWLVRRWVAPAGGN